MVTHNGQGARYQVRDQHGEWADITEIPDLFRPYDGPRGRMTWVPREFVPYVNRIERLIEGDGMTNSDVRR